MRNIVLALVAAAALAACTTGTRSSRAPDQGGHATTDGAAFLGYHGPVWRSQQPVD